MFAASLPIFRGVAVLLLLTLSVYGQQSASNTFDREVRPIVGRYCFACHSAAKHTGDVNLERFTSLQTVSLDPKVWQKVYEQISLGEMPPKGMPQPSAEERTRLLGSITATLKTASRAHAGDPGPVVLRRLNNAEYTFTIRDLTGVPSLDPAREFPADGAAGEGFMNTGNALAMSPSLVAKYMDAAKDIAAHAVLLPDGIRFSRFSTRRDWTDEILNEIRDFYQSYTEKGGAETVTQQGMALDKSRGGVLPLRKYLSASLSLRGVTSATTIDSVARRNALSAKYLTLLVNLLNDPRPSPVLDELRSRWRTAKPSDIDGLVSEISLWQQALWKFSSVGHIGKVDGPKSWMEPVNPLVDQQEFRLKLSPTARGSEVTVYLAAHNAGDGTTGDVVLWREPKLVIAGRPPVPLRDLPSLIDALTERRQRIFASTAKALAATAEASSSTGSVDPTALAARAGIDPSDLKAWFAYLGIGSQAEFKLDLLNSKIEKTGTYEFVQGWGTSKTPMLLANSSDTDVRVPGNMKARGVTVHPSPTRYAAVGWRSPVATTIRIEGQLARAHPECGNGITWSLQLRRGSTRQYLSQGEARNAVPVSIGPFERVRVQEGDLISLLVGPREGNHSCDLTAVDLRLTTKGGTSDNWSLTGDVAGNVLAGNPHSDSTGRANIWHFYTEPVEPEGTDTIIPARSLLARWQSVESPDEKQQLAEQLERLLAGPPPAAGASTPDATLYHQLTSLAGPLFASVTASGIKSPANTWGLDAKLFGKQPDGTAIDPASISVRAPSVLAIRLPGDLVTNSEFVVTGTLTGKSAGEGSVQLEVLNHRPEARTSLLPTGTAVADAKGTWTSNNQTVSYSLPVIAGSASRKRMEASFEEFRRIFPAALCYTKIVPVDEVVTLTLYYREDEALSRLMLNDHQKAKLDRLWDELHYVSRDAVASVDVFEQLWQYATQDADPSKFEPLRQPILARAATFRRLLVDTEPRHIDTVLKFADRAYRRPLTGEEDIQLRQLYRRLREQDLPHEEAIRLVLARIFVSPAFLYRAETTPPGKLAVAVNDHEMAARLSYFLWSSLPDTELRKAADAGQLHTPAAIQAQARRMLRDDRVRRLASEFGAAWLHLHDFQTLDEKSDRHFPTFKELRGAMYEESIRFFMDFFQNNRSVLNLLDADYTFVNEELAKHYGITGVAGSEWQRVDGIHKFGRGGIIGQAAVLSKQSGASRTSPILRGNFILEALLGDKLPRPPKDVPQLPTDEAAESLSVRELTEKHSTDRRCSGCHARMDPYGYTLERFDAIGRRRAEDLAGRPIHDRATLKGGVEVEGLDGLQKYLLTNERHAFVHQFCRKLLGYSLGRAIQLSDEPLLEEMETKLEQSGYHVGTVINMIVGSNQFREIRGRDHEIE